MIKLEHILAWFGCHCFIEWQILRVRFGFPDKERVKKKGFASRAEQILSFNTIAFRTAKTLQSFGRSECNRVKLMCIVHVYPFRLIFSRKLKFRTEVDSL